MKHWQQLIKWLGVAAITAVAITMCATLGTTLLAFLVSWGPLKALQNLHSILVVFLFIGALILPGLILALLQTRNAYYLFAERGGEQSEQVSKSMVTFWVAVLVAIGFEIVVGFRLRPDNFPTLVMFLALTMGASLLGATLVNSLTHPRTPDS